MGMLERYKMKEELKQLIDEAESRILRDINFLIRARVQDELEMINKEV